MSDTRKEPTPAFSCCECGEDHGHEAEDLRWCDNNLWCDECWYNDDRECDWSDLERFVPKVVSENAELKRNLESEHQFTAAINCAMQTVSYDRQQLRGHECYAKQILCSMLDLWRKKVKPVLPAYYEGSYQKIERENAALRSELAEYERLFDLQHRRSVEASQLWQKAHNQPKTWPDLGKLLEWLIERGNR